VIGPTLSCFTSLSQDLRSLRTATVQPPPPPCSLFCAFPPILFFNPALSVSFCRCIRDRFGVNPDLVSPSFRRRPPPPTLGILSALGLEVLFSTLLRSRRPLTHGFFSPGSDMSYPVGPCLVGAFGGDCAPSLWGFIRP